ncbi:DUF1275 domain containing protein [Nitzschia inconspicua]|uniref:DUF1275 domain containing protein n=1 Tax=Nitzschia inconspicua TaxID=303405 RepID=A0A9K3KX64_9STRA|nr:DUF1275 domain containing protein [Nitzschia inconspicua]
MSSYHSLSHRIQLLLLMIVGGCCQWHYAFSSSRHPVSKRFQLGSGGHPKDKYNGRFFSTATTATASRRITGLFSPLSSSPLDSPSSSSSSSLTKNGTEPLQEETTTPSTSSMSSLFSPAVIKVDGVFDDDKTNFFPLSIPFISTTATTTATTTTTTTVVNQNQESTVPQLSSISSTTPKQFLSKDRLDSRFAVAMMALAGYVEGFCLLRYHAFPNMMTGNAVKLVEAMCTCNPYKVVYYTCLIVLYMIGASLYVQWKDFAMQQQTQNNNQKHNNFQSRLTRGVAFWSILTFLASDVLFHGSTATRLPLLGMAFGILHSYTLDTVGIIPFAMTGHMGKIGMAVTQNHLLEKKQQQPSSIYDPKGYRTSIKGLFAFLASAGIANVVFAITQHVTWKRYVPPFGITLAVLYGLLFRWYDRQSNKLLNQLQQQQQTVPKVVPVL